MKRHMELILVLCGELHAWKYNHFYKYQEQANSREGEGTQEREKRRREGNREKGRMGECNRESRRERVRVLDVQQHLIL